MRKKMGCYEGLALSTMVVRKGKDLMVCVWLNFGKTREERFRKVLSG